MRFWATLIIFSLCFASSASGRDFDPKSIYQETSKAVVLIAAFDRGDKGSSTGTGSIIRKDGHVLTNAHVIFDSEKNRLYGEIRIFLKPDKVTGNLKNDTSQKFKASIVRYSNKLDLALLKIQNHPPQSGLPFLELSNLHDISIGDPVVAIGHPEQGGLWTLTTGTISSLIENFQNIPGKDVFQTETSINRGNSGGPLLDTYGNIVGVNSMIARRGKDDITITDINFSIKSTVAVKWMNSEGHAFNYATPKFIHSNEEDPLTDNAGIVPVPKQDKAGKGSEPALEVLAEHQANPKHDNLKPKDSADPMVQVEPEILTELHPYKVQDLFQQVEDEMEDMMEEMKGRIRSR